MASIAKGLTVAVALPLALAVGHPAVHAKALPGGEAEQIGSCIKAASRDALWLERTLWGLRDQEGGWIGAQVANANGTHDLGPLQVNSWWVPRIAKAIAMSEEAVRYQLRFDPCFNVEVARWIFLSGLASTRDYWKAIGIYHSPIGWRQRLYARSVVRHLQRRYGPEIFRGLAQRSLRP
ncbi:MAG: murein transglycosylase [Sphingobium sp.]|nr:murein transglycosylase [Sphingobium sp.]